MTDYRLRLPGPTTVPERVRQAIARPIVSHRGPEFREVSRRAAELLRPLMGTQNPILFCASSGTGMMEASLVNILGPHERILVSTHGQFGERFASIARAMTAQTMGATVDTIDPPWGTAPTAGEIAHRLEHHDYRAVVIVHNESSTGVVAPLAEIGAVVRRYPALLIVDSVSGLGGIEMRQDEWGIDILITASQKALMCPPGLGIASVSPKARAIIERDDRLPRFYWDFRKALDSAVKFETPYTTPVALVTGLREALEMIHEEGLDHVLARHARLSADLRRGCGALGLPSFPRSPILSNTVVCLTVPESLRGPDIVRGMYQRHRTVIAGSRNKLDGRVIRIGTMGYFDDSDILTDLFHLADTLESLTKETAHAG